MKYLVLVLLLATAAFALHDPTDPVVIPLQGTTSDGSVGHHNASWTTLRGNSIGTAGLLTNNVAADTGVSVGKFASGNFFLHRSYFQSETVDDGSKYEDSVVVAAGNTASGDSLVFKVYLTNAVDSGGCSGKIYCIIQNPLATSATGVPLTVAAGTYNDWLGGVSGTWVVMDSVALDTNAFGVGDTAQVTFSATGAIAQYFISLLANAGVATTPGLLVALVSCYDYDNATPTVSTGNTIFRADVLYSEFTGSDKDPVFLQYWTERPPSSNLLSGWQSSWGNEQSRRWKGLWR